STLVTRQTPWFGYTTRSPTASLRGGARSGMPGPASYTIGCGPAMPRVAALPASLGTEEASPKTPPPGKATRWARSGQREGLGPRASGSSGPTHRAQRGCGGRGEGMASLGVRSGRRATPPPVGQLLEDAARRVELDALGPQFRLE